MTEEKNKEKLKERAAKSVIWGTVENVGVRVITLLAFLVLVRLLEKEAFGLVALALVYITFLELVVRVGVTEVIVVQRELSELHKDTAYWVSAALGTVAILLSFSLAPFVGEWSDQPELASILSWLTLIIIPTSLTRVQEGILMRELKYRSLAIRRLLGSSCGVMVGIGCAMQGYGVWSLVAQQLTDRFVDFFTLYWVTRWFPKFRFSRLCLRDMSGYAWKIMGANVVNFAGLQADRFLIGHFLGVTALGVYVVGRRIVEVLLGLMTNVIGRVALSAFSMVQADMRKLQIGSIAVARICAVAGFPAFMFLVIAGDEVNLLLFGEKWSDAGPIVELMAGAALMRVAVIFAPPLLRARGMPGRVIIALACQAIASIFLAALMSPLGLNAMAAGWVVGDVISAMIFLIWLRPAADIKAGEIVRVYAGPLISALAAAVLVWMLNETISIFSLQAWMKVIVASLVFLAGYALTLRVIAPVMFKHVISDLTFVFQKNSAGGGESNG